MKVKKIILLLPICLFAVLLFAITSCKNTSNSRGNAISNTGRVHHIPPDNIDNFWNNLNWSELTSNEQAQWNILGWDQNSWQGRNSPPASENKKWNQLTKREQTAAKKLGYKEKEWNTL